MDDTVAMQDVNVRDRDGPTAGVGPIDDKLAVLKGVPAVPTGPITPPQGSDGVSVASDSSSQEQNTRQPVLLSRAMHSGTDVDAAKQAALSALAGLDLTTTKANLDASKAAAATAKANGEVPVLSRKSNLRSVSCRQLGSSSTSSAATAGKTVAFDDTAKPRMGPEHVRPAPGQWRTTAVADGVPRRTTRAPASRCISLPHIMQGSAGSRRLAAPYSHDAALQQQLQLLGGAAGQQYVGYGQVQQGGAHQMDALSMYQLQQQLQQQVANAPAALLAQQRTFVPGAVSLDDSVVPVQAGNIILQRAQHPLQQLQQVQPQQAMLAGTWSPAAATAAPQQQLAAWTGGQVAQQSIGQAGGGNVQLLAQLQAGSQGQFKGDTIWVAPASTSLQLPSSRSQGMMMQQSAVPSDLAGMAGLQQQQQQQLLAGQLQPSGIAGSVASTTAGGTQIAAGVAANDDTLLETYQSVSWSVLAAAQGESSLRNQLLTELVLLLTLLHTLNNMMKGNMSAAEALSDLNYLVSAARHHMATFSRLSQAGNIAVQLLAVITPLALRRLNSSELLEAAFLILDTLALASRDIAVVVSQQRMAALASMGMQVPMDRLLQQQTLGLHWIAGLASAVSRNKVVLESMADDSSAHGAAGAGPGLSGSGLMGGAGMTVGSSQPMMVAPTANATAALGSNALSPNRKTPLATYFEETSMAPGASPGPGAAASMSSVAAAGGAGGMVLSSNGLGGVQLASPTGQADASAAGSGLTAVAGGYAGLDNLGGLSLGLPPGKLAPAGPGPQTTAAMVGFVGTGTYSPLGGGLSLFGDGAVMAPGSRRGPSSSGAVGV